MKRQITFEDLPQEAKDGIGEELDFYLDDLIIFATFQNYYEVWFNGELLALWDGCGWTDALLGQPIHNGK